MIKNFLKITFRNLIKQRGITFINVMGLAIGMTCFIYITIWVLDELSYDVFHENGEELFRIICVDGDNPESNGSAGCPFLVPTVLKDNYPIHNTLYLNGHTLVVYY